MTIGPIALAWHRAGFCAVPVRSNGSKAPAVDWKIYQNRLPNDVELANWWGAGARQGFGLIMGATSGNAEMLEFEGRAVDLLPEVMQRVRNHDLAGVFLRLWTGYRELTPSGGIHLVFRVSDGPALPNLKLASRPRTRDELLQFLPGEIARLKEKGSQTAKIEGYLATVSAPDVSVEELVDVGSKFPYVLIETRGEGGFTVTAPSNGTTHPSGGQWTLQAGQSGVVPMLTCAERDALYDVLRSFDEMPNQQINVDRIPRSSSTDVFSGGYSSHVSPLDAFNESADWGDILTPNGWTYLRTDQDGTNYWERPGQEEGGKTGATTGHADSGDRLYIFSTSTDLEAHVPHNKAYVWAHYNHGGDLKAAAAALYEAGWGDRRRDTQSGIGFEGDDRPWFLPEDFWTSRPIFDHLRRAAWSQLECPEGVLVAAICLTLYYVEPNVVLSAPVGSEASLNLMAVLCGNPSDGKSVCRKIAKNALDFGSVKPFYSFSPSSGQGIARQYQHLVKPRGGDSYMQTDRTSAFAIVEESDSLGASAKQTASTLTSELRKAAMGEELGSGNVGETRTNLPEGDYRFVMLMCMQPELAGWLLDGSSGGLPQRFLWASVRDPRIVDDIPHPGKHKIYIPLEAQPDPLNDLPKDRYVMQGSPRIWDEIREARRQRKMLGDDDVSMDGHSILTRRKVSAALAIMDGRIEDNDEDWDLAEMIIEMSDAARAWVLSRVQIAAARENENRSKARAKGRHVENATLAKLERETEEDVRDAIVKSLQAEPKTRRKLIMNCRPAQRWPDLEGLLEQMIAEGEIRGVEDGRSLKLYPATEGGVDPFDDAP
jgi:hypothetical protein